MNDVHLDTEDQIGQAGGYVLGLRYQLDADIPLTTEEQRQVVAIAEAALLRLKPIAPGGWTDTAAGPVPEWLRRAQENHR